jgi:hypothetical protein
MVGDNILFFFLWSFFLVFETPKLCEKNMCLFYLIEDYHVHFFSCEFVRKSLCLTFGLGFSQGMGE